MSSAGCATGQKPFCLFITLGFGVFFLLFFLQLCPLGVNLTQCKSLEGWSPQGPVLLLARPSRLQGRLSCGSGAEAELGQRGKCLEWRFCPSPWVTAEEAC